MKKSILLTLAALTIIFTQCKKAENVVPQGGTTQSGKTIEISLKVNNNSKFIVDPGSSTASVMFQTGDVIHVASDGKYSGTLTRDGGSFKGTITEPGEGATMYFYFLGNRNATDAAGNALSTTTGSESESLMVDISDQSSELPVISYGQATYNSTTTEYSATLRNQCALVKFTAADTHVSGTLTLKGINNKVTVTLGDQSFTYGKVDDDGLITLNNTAVERVYWAILLPQEETTEVAAYTDCLTGHAFVSAIAANYYNSTGIAVTDFYEYVDLGLSVKWAKYNLGVDPYNIHEYPDWYGDYYAWAATTTWYSAGAHTSSPTWKDGYSGGYCLENFPYGIYTGSMVWLTKYTNSAYAYDGVGDDKTTIEPSDDAATVNWGCGWRIPTEADWTELYNNTTKEKTVENGVTGIKFTSKVEGYTNKSIFLQFGGTRRETKLNGAGSLGSYWLSSLESHQTSAYVIVMNIDNLYKTVTPRCYGQTMRPVCK